MTTRLRTAAAPRRPARPAPSSSITVVEGRTTNWSRPEARDLATDWVTAGVALDAVVADNDEPAIGALPALRSARVPQEEEVAAGGDATPDGLAAAWRAGLDVTAYQSATRRIRTPFEPVTADNLDRQPN